MTKAPSSEVHRFSDFVLDVAAYDLRRQGRPVRLEQQPMDLLILLVSRRGKLVSREEITAHLWGADVFIDVETGIHTAIRKVRQALGDSAERPSFVETVPGKGYRFIAPVEGGSAEPLAPSPEEVAAAPDMAAASEPTAMSRAGPRPGGRAWVALGLGALLGIAGAGMWTWRAGTPAPSRVTVAVLPFENLSADPDREYLADGLSEETIASLGQADPERLFVVGRTSVKEYKRAPKPLAEIGRELGADYIVEGSARSEGGRVRITSRLVRARDQVQVWSESWDREPQSLLGLQRELSGAIAAEVQLRLSPARAAALTDRQTRQPDAYDLYLRGSYYARQHSPPTMARAIEYFERAVAADPGYALAWSALANAQASRPVNSDFATAEIRDRVHDAVAKAVATGSHLAEVQVSLGIVKYWFDWDWLRAEGAFRRAIALDPSHSRAHQMLGHVLSQMGRDREGIAAMERSRELDPLWAMNHALSAQVAFQARDYEAAIQHARRAVALDPEFWIAYMELGQAQERLGRNELALDALLASSRFSGGNSKPLALRGYLLGRMGRTGEAHEVVEALEAVSRTRYVPPYAFALVFAGLGRREAALEWLERAYEVRDVHLTFLPADPKWDPFKEDPRFQALLARCTFARADETTQTGSPGRSP
jgi:TolB-like protein/DNA-binding winged helix-turn-helix (wHTH) protein/Flp pilus assembly protein TadD